MAQDADTDTPVVAIGGQAYLALARQMMLTSRRWRARFDERMKKVGQTHARYRVLYWIADSGNQIVQRDLADRMGIEEPTLARLLDALQVNGMVERQRSPYDGRSKLVNMTQAALPVLQGGHAQVAALVEEAFVDITEEEARACLKVLTKLHQRLEKIALGPATMQKGGLEAPAAVPGG